MMKINTKTIFTTSVVLIPILSMYKFIGSFIDLGLVLTTVTLLITLATHKDRIKLKRPLTPWVLYVFIIWASTFFAVFFPFSSSLSTIIGRALRNILCVLIFIAGSSGNCFNGEKAKKIYLFVVKAATLYIFFQTFAARLFNIVVPGYVGLLIRKVSYVVDLQLTSASTFRPSSFFYEPSHYFIYVVVAFTVFLFSRKDKQNIFWACLISGGIILSGSGMGVLSVGMLWGIWFIQLLLKTLKCRKISVYHAAIVGFLCLAIFLLARSTRFSNILIRIFDDKAQGGSAISGRASGYLAMQSMPVFNLLFGYGFGNLPMNFYSSLNFYPSFLYNFLCMGILGTGVTFLALRNVYKRVNNWSAKLGFFVYILLCFYGETFMSTYLVFFMFLFQYSNDSLDF